MYKKIAFSLALGSLLVAGITLAQTATPTPVVSPSSTPVHSPKPVVDTACMQSAVDKRDSLLETAVDHYASTVKTALETRKTALKTAWGMSDVKARHKSQKDAWEAYRKSVRTARRVFKTDRNTAWKQFKTDSKACHAEGEDKDDGGEGADSQL